MYSVHSRLIGAHVDVRLYTDLMEVYYAQRQVEKNPRLRGEPKHNIQQRHIIDRWIHKSNAFENFRS